MTRRALVAVGCVVAAGLGFALTVPIAAPPTSGILSYSAIEDGVEVGVVLVVSPNCAACNDPLLPDAWSAIRTRYMNALDDASERLTLTAIVTSRTPTAGWEFIQRFGDFNEVSVGRQWQGSAAIRFFTEKHLGPLAIPQVFVYRRDVRRSTTGEPEFVNERVTERYVGVDEVLALARWSAASVPGNELADG